MKLSTLETKLLTAVTMTEEILIETIRKIANTIRTIIEIYFWAARGIYNLGKSPGRTYYNDLYKMTYNVEESYTIESKDLSQKLNRQLEPSAKGGQLSPIYDHTPLPQVIKQEEVDIPPRSKDREFLNASQQRATEGSLTVAPRHRLKSGDAPSKTETNIPQNRAFSTEFSTQSRNKIVEEQINTIIQQTELWDLWISVMEPIGSSLTEGQSRNTRPKRKPGRPKGSKNKATRKPNKTSKRSATRQAVTA